MSDKSTTETNDLKQQLFGFWDQAAEYYQLARQYNMEATPERQRMRGFIPKGSAVLDVGSGAGENGFHIRDVANYTGLEYSSTAIEMAREFESPTCRYLQGDAENMPFEDASFDVVLSTHVIEHLTNPQRVIDEMLRVLKPGGRLMIIGPAWEWPLQSPPSCKQRSKSLWWRIRWSTGRFWRLLVNDPGFDMIENPDILEGAYEEDNDTTYAVSVRLLLRYLENLGLEPEYVQRFADVADEWGHRGPFRWFMQTLTLFPPFRYVHACLFIVVKKPVL